MLCGVQREISGSEESGALLSNICSKHTAKVTASRLSASMDRLCSICPLS